jgi:hypothetical protein
VGAAPDVNAKRTGESCAIWFDRNAFTQPTTGTYATSQEKNSLRSTRLLGREHAVPQRLQRGGSAQRFELRIEAFNILNRARLFNAVTNPTSGDFGYIVQKIGSRTMQIGMQYLF